MKKIYYEKVGRRYKPVSEYDYGLMDSLPKGDHLISVYLGGRSTHYNINPNYAALIAAGRIAQDAIAEKIRQGSEAKSKQHPITEQQRLAWEKLKEVFNDEFFSLTLPAAIDLANAGVKAMQDEADKLMKHESVRAAYEHFMLVCELTKEHTNAKAR